jgi:hypothetical protein
MQKSGGVQLFATPKYGKLIYGFNYFKMKNRTCSLLHLSASM